MPSVPSLPQPIKKMAFLYPHYQSRRATLAMPPIGLEYVAAAVEDLIDEIVMVDVRFDPPEVVEKKLADVDVIGVSIMWATRLQKTWDVINSLPAKIPTVVGGAYASIAKDMVMENCPNVDVLVDGEGEETLRDLVQGQPWDKVPGIMYRHQSEIHTTPCRAYPPFPTVRYPNRKHRDPNHHFGFHLPGVNWTLPMDIIQTSRGCPFKCKFCADFISLRKWQSRPVESVIGEIKEIDTPYLMISDDFFTHDVKRIEELCDALIAEGLDKTIACQTRISITKHPKVLKKMEQAGVAFILFGIESVQNRTLKAIKKGILLKDVKKAFDVMSKTNIIANANFIVGQIGETRPEMLEIARVASKYKIDTILLSLLRNDEGSRLGEILEDFPEYYISPDGRIFSERYGKKDLKDIFKLINYRFYLDFETIRKLPKFYRSRLRRALWFFLQAGVFTAGRYLTRRLFGKRKKREAYLIEGAKQLV